MLRSRPGGGTFHIEDVQDQVELGLMRGSHHEVARAYVLYRERRAQERAAQKEQQSPAAPEMHVIDGGQRVALDVAALRERSDLPQSVAVNVAVQVMPPSLLVSVPREPPTTDTSALLKPVTASVKVIVTADVLLASLSASAVSATVEDGLAVSMPTVSDAPVRPISPTRSV